MKKFLKKLKLKIRKHHLYQLGFLIINTIITIVIPIVTYINFKNTLRNFDCPDCTQSIINQVYLGGMESFYDILVYVFVFVGIIVTTCSYFINRFQKYSVQRGILMVIISIVYLFNILFSSQMSNIIIKIANIQLVVNSFGVFILFITISLLYVLKTLFDLIDFKINKMQYDKIIRKEHTTKVKQVKMRAKIKKELEAKLIECPQCNYICSINWKKCPICETKI